MGRRSPLVCSRLQWLLLLALLSIVSPPCVVYATVCQSPPCTSSTCYDQTEPGLVQLPVATVYDLVSPPGSPNASNAVDGSLYSCWSNIAEDSTGTVYPHFDFSGDGALTYWVAGFSLFNYNGARLVRVTNGSIINSGAAVATYTMPTATSQSSTYYVLPNPVLSSGLTVAQWPATAQCEALFWGEAALPIMQVVDPIGFGTQPVALNDGGPVSSIIDGVGTSFWHPISGPSTTLFFTQLTLNLNPASQYSVTGFKLRLLYDGAHAPQTVWLISGAATSTAGAVQAWSVDGYNVDGYVPSTNSGYTTYTLNSALTVQYNGVVTIAYQTPVYQLFLRQVVLLGGPQSYVPVASSRAALTSISPTSCTSDLALVRKFYDMSNAPWAVANNVLGKTQNDYDIAVDWWGGMVLGNASFADVPACFDYLYLDPTDSTMSTAFASVAMSASNPTTKWWNYQNGLGLSNAWGPAGAWNADQVIMAQYFTQISAIQSAVSAALVTQYTSYATQWGSSTNYILASINSIFVNAQFANVQNDLQILQSEIAALAPNKDTLVAGILGLFASAIPGIGVAFGAAAEGVVDVATDVGLAAGIIGAGVTLGPLAMPGATGPLASPFAVVPGLSSLYSPLGTGVCSAGTCTEWTYNDISSALVTQAGQAWNSNSAAITAILSNWGYTQLLFGRVQPNQQYFDPRFTATFTSVGVYHVDMFQAWAALRMFFSVFSIQYVDLTSASQTLNTALTTQQCSWGGYDSCVAPDHLGGQVFVPLNENCGGPGGSYGNLPGVYMNYGQDSLYCGNQYGYQPGGVCKISLNSAASNSFPTWDNVAWAPLRAIFAKAPFSNFFLAQPPNITSCAGSGTNNNCCNNLESTVPFWPMYCNTHPSDAAGRVCQCITASDYVETYYWVLSSDDAGCNAAAVNSMFNAIVPTALFGGADPLFQDLVAANLAAQPANPGPGSTDWASCSLPGSPTPPPSPPPSPPGGGGGSDPPPGGGGGTSPP